MVVDVGALVLHQAEYRDAMPSHRIDVCPCIFGGLDNGGADRRKHTCDLPQRSPCGWIEDTDEAERMSGAEIAFDRADVIPHRSLVFAEITAAPRAAVLLIHPRNHAQRASRYQAEQLAQMGHLHGDRHASGVVDCTRAKVPGIKVT